MENWKTKHAGTREFPSISSNENLIGVQRTEKGKAIPEELCNLYNNWWLYPRRQLWSCAMLPRLAGRLFLPASGFSYMCRDLDTWHTVHVCDLCWDISVHACVKCFTWVENDGWASKTWQCNDRARDTRFRKQATKTNTHTQSSWQVIRHSDNTDADRQHALCTGNLHWTN